MTETAETNLHNEFYLPESSVSDLVVNPTDSELDKMSMISTIEAGEQVDGIEILVGMAKSGKIDPWNVDIVDVTDKYLAHLFQMKAQNLRLTGRTLLFAAILLRLKSNVLEGIDINQIEGNEPDYNEFEMQDDYGDSGSEEDINTNNVISLDEVLQRRTSIRLNRSRTVNLKDLIKQLQFYEELDRKQSLKNAHERAKRRVRSYARLTPDDIVNLAHDEYIEKSVNVLHENLKKIFETEEKVELATLTLLGLDKISAYIALLFLTAEPESEIDLYQEEFYGELYAVPYKKPLEEKESA